MDGRVPVSLLPLSSSLFNEPSELQLLGRDPLRLLPERESLCKAFIFDQASGTVPISSFPDRSRVDKCRRDHSDGRVPDSRWKDKRSSLRCIMAVQLSGKGPERAPPTMTSFSNLVRVDQADGNVPLKVLCPGTQSRTPGTSDGIPSLRVLTRFRLVKDDHCAGSVPVNWLSFNARKDSEARALQPGGKLPSKQLDCKPNDRKVYTLIGGSVSRVGRDPRSLFVPNCRLVTIGKVNQLAGRVPFKRFSKSPTSVKAVKEDAQEVGRGPVMALPYNQSC